MIRNFKVLGLAVVAMLAMTAVAASAAQAKQFHAESAPVTVIGTQTETARFTVTAGSITCTVGHFTGSSAVVTTETLTITPSYSGCKFLGQNVTVNFGSCDYEFNANGTVSVGGGTACDNNPISFEAAGCKVTVGSTLNQNMGGITYTNQGAGEGRTVKVTPNVTSIVYTQTASCPNGAAVNHGEGVYKEGAATVRGEDAEEKEVGLWVE